MRSFLCPTLVAVMVGGLAAGCANSKKGTPDPNTTTDPNVPAGTTDFVTESTGNGPITLGGDSNGTGGSASGNPQVAIDGAGAGGSSGTREAAPGAPSGRDATVEEADIYRIDNDRLFYFNTYRGLIIYDLKDPKNPQQLSRLGVYGYPIEMFVQGNTVFALLSDALYLTQANGKLQFERHNVSQMVAIDVSDLRNPRIIKTVDIIGQLREGVSRKIDNTIYVVSYISQYYYYGWGYSRDDGQQNAQAWVYSFDVSNPLEPKQVGQLQIFEGGTVNISDPKGQYSYNRNFNNVAISATSNALMVVENWWVSNYVSNGTSSNGYYGCTSSYYNSFQQSVVSIIDVSDPKGSIRRHTKFDTPGTIGDQFKMTYVFDPATQKGTFYGIFARQAWSGSNCSGTSHVANTLESWDITDGANPTLLSALDFGKPDETVRGSTFDTDRQVAYAITAKNVDPLYAISIADPKNLKVLSAVDGLSGDMTVFRLIGDNKYLLGIGRDNSATCTGFQGTDGQRSTNMAVSIIDVRDLSKVRLVQRQCVAVKNAGWVGSDISWNLDQAHKMIGMFSDAEANVVTVPVYYWTRSDPNDDWWWNEYKSAVGIMSWDLTKYDDSKPETQQSVLQNFGTFIHPNGQVMRTIVFKHQATGQRMMVNLSDTHASIANLQNLAQPVLQSVIEVAPYVSQVFSFATPVSNYMVTQVQSQPYYYGNPNQDLSQFRVYAAGGDLDKAPVLASFSVGQVQQAIKHGNQMLLFRTLPQTGTTKDYNYRQSVQVLVYDLTDPTHPRRAGSTVIDGGTIPYYPYRCGWDGYWGGYWSMGYGSWTEVQDGIVALNQYYNYDPTYTTNTYTNNLVFLDLRNSNAPKVSTQNLATSSAWNSYSMIGDPVDPTGFYLGRSETVGTRNGQNGTVFTQYRYYAERWNRSGSGFAAAEKVNIPGPLVRTWAGADGTRMFLTQDQVSFWVAAQGSASVGNYESYARLNLLKQVSVSGKPAASLLDSKTFTNAWLTGLTMNGNTMYVAANPNYYYGYYDNAPAGTATWETTSTRLMIFDLGSNTFASLYDQPTKANNLSIMGANQGRLFINLSGDGVLAVDVSNPAQPTGSKFLRTLGWASTMEAAGDDLYVASGYFGLDHMSLSAADAMPIDP
jgi:hypothetical protein